MIVLIFDSPSSSTIVSTTASSSRERSYGVCGITRGLASISTWAVIGRYIR
jgi:hypothetical protein